MQEVKSSKKVKVNTSVDFSSGGVACLVQDGPYRYYQHATAAALCTTAELELRGKVSLENITFFSLTELSLRIEAMQNYFCF